MNKRDIVVLTCVLAAGSVCAGLYCQGPDARHAWAIHDRNRPNPVKVEAPEGRPPSDAVVLFDGTRASADRNWYTGRDGTCRWEVVEGALRCTPKTGNAVTRRVFADCQLHLEWKTPKPATGWGQGRGNSGVILFGGYEIQVLDSYLTDPSKTPNPNPNYADGQAGAVYAQNPPLVNPARPEGAWQSYDIVFHAPVWDGDTLVKGPTVTLFFNGVLVQDGWPFQGTTTWCRRVTTHAEAEAAPLVLQDHGHPVQFRNIWIRRIPSRYADTVNGSLGTKEGDVAKLRHDLAAQSLAFADATDDAAEVFIRLWESYCYEPDRAVKRRLGPAEDACLAAFAEGRGSFGNPRRVSAFRRFVKMLVASGWMPRDAKIATLLEKTPAPPKPKAPNLRDI